MWSSFKKKFFRQLTIASSTGHDLISAVWLFPWLQLFATNCDYYVRLLAAQYQTVSSDETTSNDGFGPKSHESRGVPPLKIFMNQFSCRFPSFSLHGRFSLVTRTPPSRNYLYITVIVPFTASLTLRTVFLKNIWVLLIFLTSSFLFLSFILVALQALAPFVNGGSSSGSRSNPSPLKRTIALRSSISCISTTFLLSSSLNDLFLVTIYA